MFTKIEDQPVKGKLSLEQDPRTITFLRNIVRRGTEQVVKNQFPYANSQIVRESSLVEGASGAITIMVDSQMQLMFKVDPERAANEIQGFLIMEKALPNHTLPLLACDASVGWLCVPYVSAANLHRIIEKSLLSETQVLAVYDDFLRQMSALWIRTFADEPADNHYFIKRLQRKKSNLESLLVPFAVGHSLSFAELFSMPVHINGIAFPSINEMANVAIDLLAQNPAPQTVTAHGDEHAKNILIQTPVFDDELRWFLIDLPNVSSETDWVWSIVQMRQWWQVSFYIDQAMYAQEWQRAPVCFDISQGNLLIEYELGEHIPPICHVLDRKVENLAQNISDLFEDRIWQRRYAAFMFLLFYGLVSHYRQNEHILPLLFGEMARALSAKLP